MPRSSRVVVTDTPHHLIQRGHNRAAVFATDEDFQYYLANLWGTQKRCQEPFYCRLPAN